MVDEWLHSIQSVIYPPSCILCGASGQRPTFDLCAGCQGDLPVNRPACLRCAMPLASDTATAALECGACLEHAPTFNRAYAAFRYAYPVDQMIHAFKYQSALAWGRVLATLLARYLAARDAAMPEALVPVPLHAERHRERGFNQALELARTLGRSLGVRVEDELCHRVRATLDQTALDARERRRNLRGAFEVMGPLNLRHVAVIDDVLTTGSTASALARALARAGAKAVDVWVVARSARTREL